MNPSILTIQTSNDKQLKIADLVERLDESNVASLSFEVRMQMW